MISWPLPGSGQRDATAGHAARGNRSRASAHTGRPQTPRPTRASGPVFDRHSRDVCAFASPSARLLSVRFPPRATSLAVPARAPGARARLLAANHRKRPHDERAGETHLGPSGELGHAGRGAEFSRADAGAILVGAVDDAGRVPGRIAREEGDGRDTRLAARGKQVGHEPTITTQMNAHEGSGEKHDAPQREQRQRRAPALRDTHLGRCREVLAHATRRQTDARRWSSSRTVDRVESRMPVLTRTFCQDLAPRARERADGPRARARGRALSPARPPSHLGRPSARRSDARVEVADLARLSLRRQPASNSSTRAGRPPRSSDGLKVRAATRVAASAASRPAVSLMRPAEPRCEVRARFTPHVELSPGRRSDGGG